ncbi:MAG: hypothetical protein IPK19_25930 [Chloroflexi bacterium]|nr:hypothetical protein [Chloroflexota bacterium]
MLFTLRTTGAGIAEWYRRSPVWRQSPGFLIGTAMFAVGGAVGMEFAYYFILVSIFVSVFLSRRQTMLCVVGVAIAILSYQWANPQLPLMTTLRGPLAFNLFATGFVSVFTSFWRLREREKRRQLERASGNALSYWSGRNGSARWGGSSQDLPTISPIASPASRSTSISCV